MKKQYISGEKKVYTKQDLEIAMKNRQEKILIQGTLAKKIAKDIDSNGVKLIGAAACALGSLVFSPLMIPLAGICAGATDYSLYVVTNYKEMEEYEQLTLELKPEVKEKLGRKENKAESSVSKALDKLGI